MFFAGFYHMTNRQDWLKEIFFLSVFSPNVFIISCWIKPDCYCSEEEWLLNRVGGGCWQRENYCKWLAQWEGRGKVLIRCACCGLQTTFMNLPETDWHITVCPCVYMFVCLTKRERQDRGSTWDISKAMKHRRNTIPTSIDYLSTGWRVCRFMLTYKQPGDWLAPVWSMLAQVRRVVPWAVSLHRLYNSQRFRVILIT